LPTLTLPLRGSFPRPARGERVELGGTVNIDVSEIQAGRAALEQAAGDSVRILAR